MSNQYEVRITGGHAISLNTLRGYDTFTGEIVRTATGAVAYRTRPYTEARTARLQAARLRKNYEHHLAKHGIGWEEQEAERKAKAKAEREAKREADRRLRDAAPDLLAALEGLLAAPAASGSAPDRYDRRDAAVVAARAAIAKAQGAPD